MGGEWTAGYFGPTGKNPTAGGASAFALNPPPSPNQAFRFISHKPPPNIDQVLPGIAFAQWRQREC